MDLQQYRLAALRVGKRQCPGHNEWHMRNQIQAMKRRKETHEKQEFKNKRHRQRRTTFDIPTALICKAIAHGTHVVANGGPFGAANDANVLYGQNGKEQVLVGTIIPILVIHGRRDRPS